MYSDYEIRVQLRPNHVMKFSQFQLAEKYADEAAQISRLLIELYDRVLHFQSARAVKVAKEMTPSLRYARMLQSMFTKYQAEGCEEQLNGHIDKENVEFLNLINSMTEDAVGKLQVYTISRAIAAVLRCQQVDVKQ